MGSGSGAQRVKALFVTGTDTGVGKTHFACWLVGFLKKMGLSVGVMKPAETGEEEGSDDHIRLMKAAGTNAPREVVCPYFLKKPLAPSRAAALEKKRIRISQVKKALWKLLEAHHLVVVEGAGGIMVPLTGNYTYLNLVQDLSLPVIIVAENKLGVINHTLLTFHALKSSDVPVISVVLNEKKGQSAHDLSLRYNLMDLKKLLPVPIIYYKGALTAGEERKLKRRLREFSLI